MKILILDSNKDTLTILSDLVRVVIMDADIFTFTNARSVIEFVRNNIIDVLFIDLNIKGDISCLKVIQEIQKIRPKTNILFCGDKSKFNAEYLHFHYSGFLEQPYNKDKIEWELSNLRYPIGKVENNRVYFQCFGNFEVFINGIPLKFVSEKTKEMLAYLVDRNGSMCRNKEIMAILWDDGKLHNSYLKKIKFELINLFKENGCEDVLVIHRGSIGINKANVDCDYYDWKRGVNDQLYQGEYMIQYSWAEYTINY